MEPVAPKEAAEPLPHGHGAHVRPNIHRQTPVLAVSRAHTSWAAHVSNLERSALTHGRLPGHAAQRLDQPVHRHLLLLGCAACEGMEGRARKCGIGGITT